MNNALSKITAALLAVLLLFLVPAVQAAQREEDLKVLSTYNMLVQFTDAIRSKGYLSPQMYNDFARELEMIGGVYNIELEHRHKKYHPEYSDPANPATFMNGFSVIYDAYYTMDFLKVLFPPDPLQVQDELRTYTLKSGDYITVSLENRSTSILSIINGFLHGLFPGGVSEQRLTYGGMVFNEDY